MILVLSVVGNILLTGAVCYLLGARKPSNEDLVLNGSSVLSGKDFDEMIGKLETRPVDADGINVKYANGETVKIHVVKRSLSSIIERTMQILAKDKPSIPELIKLIPTHVGADGEQLPDMEGVKHVRCEHALKPGFKPVMVVNLEVPEEAAKQLAGQVLSFDSYVRST